MTPIPDPPNQRQILTVAQMHKCEQALIKAGATAGSLMETAGKGAGGWVCRMASGRAVTVLCGPGNNGGDGYVIARYLVEHGVAAHVIAPAPPRTPAAMAARAAFTGTVSDCAAGDLPTGEVFVDALFGTGQTRAIGDDLFALVTGLAARHHRRVAIDLPSGIDSDSGACRNAGVPAFDLTVALGAWKHAHFAMPAARVVGALRLVGIGCGAVAGAAQVLDTPHVYAPDAEAHKYRRGLLAIVGGAMPGAALLAALAARHAGAGYIRLLTDREQAAAPPDLVVARGDLSGALTDSRIAAVLVGPGLGRDSMARDRLVMALGAGRPCVIDADALILLRPGMAPSEPVVLTPHDGELVALERAFGLTGDGLKRDRAIRLAAAAGAVVVAKGPATVIAAPDGRLVIAPLASSWLSVAGTGDVLAGIIASRLAVLRDGFAAACEAVWLHGEAARIAGPAFAASDLASAVAAAVRRAL